MKAIEEFKRRITLMFSAFSSIRKRKCEHVFTAYKRFDCEEKCYPAKIDFNSVKLLDQVIERKPKNLIKKTNM